jgi:hypothetical protein
MSLPEVTPKRVATKSSLALKVRGSKTYRLQVDLGPNSIFFVIPAKAGIQ